MPSENHGRFVWYDLMTTEPSSAEEFYRQLIGWGTQSVDVGDMPYTMWANSDQPVGGVMELPADARAAGAPPHWLAYVEVDDLASSTQRVRTLGGEIHHGPTEIPGAGSFSIAADPQGAVFALYQPAGEHPSESSLQEVGRFSWHELATSDYKGALSFYSELFGWRPQEAMDMGEGIYQIYGRGETPLGGMFNKPDEMPGPPMWLYYVKVDDVDASVEKVKQLGGQVVNGPMDVPGGDRIAQCLDPQGALFALHSSG